MKKIFPIAALALAGCSIYPGAAEWSKAGYSVEGFRNCRQLGLLKPDVLPVLKRFFSYENDLNYCPTEVIKISSGIDAGKFTLDDLKTFVNYLDKNVFDLRDTEFLGKYYIIDNSQNLVSAISDIHRGVDAQTILSKAFDSRRQKIAALRRAQEEKQLEKKREEEQRLAEEKKFQTRIKNAIGSEGVSLCGGVDTKKWPEFGYYSNPYAPVGKCYLTTIRYFMNGVQWLSREKLLVIQPLPPGLGYQQPILFKGSEPIRVGVEAIVYGEEPETYESALGAVVNPTTYRVLLSRRLNKIFIRIDALTTDNKKRRKKIYISKTSLRNFMILRRLSGFIFLSVNVYLRASDDERDTLIRCCARKIRNVDYRADRDGQR